jgi:hypothetical protein
MFEKARDNPGAAQASGLVGTGSPQSLLSEFMLRSQEPALPRASLEELDPDLVTVLQTVLANTRLVGENIGLRTEQRETLTSALRLALLERSTYTLALTDFVRGLDTPFSRDLPKQELQAFADRVIHGGSGVLSDPELCLLVFNPVLLHRTSELLYLEMENGEPLWVSPEWGAVLEKLKGRAV